jgi:hypothetical protein
LRLAGHGRRLWRERCCNKRAPSPSYSRPLAIRSTAVSSRANRLEAVATLGAAAKTTEAAAPEATEAATAAPSRITDTPTRGYACEASMAGHRVATARTSAAFPTPNWAIPVLRDCSPISPQGGATSHARTCHSAPFHADQAEKSACQLSADISFWAPRKIAPPRQTPQNCPQMIPLRSRSDSFTFTPGLLASASESNFSRCPSVFPWPLADRSSSSILSAHCTSHSILIDKLKRAPRSAKRQPKQFLLGRVALGCA